MRIGTLALAAALMPLWGQENKIALNLDQLAAKARESVDVTLSGPMLRLAGRFITRQDKLLAGLESISVRSFEFTREGEYTASDVDSVRAQVSKAPWFRLAGVKSKEDGTVEIYCKDVGNGRFGGVMVIAAGPRELAVVSVVGNLDPAQLAALGGQFGIPGFDLDGEPERKK
jgi:hypothetical protein